MSVIIVTSPACRVCGKHYNPDQQSLDSFKEAHKTCSDFLVLSRWWNDEE